MRYTISLVGLLGIGALALDGCSSSGAVPGDAAVIETDAGAETGPGPDGGGGPGSSCANAIPIKHSVRTAGALDAVGKSLFYSMDVAAGDILGLIAQTAAKPDTPATAVVDTTISVFDATGTKLLASDDDAFPRGNSDAYFFYRPPTSAGICIQVTDFATWNGETGTVAADPNFSLLVGVLNPDSDFVTVDQEPNDTTAAPQVGHLKVYTTPGYTSGSYGIVAGVLSSAADVDTYKFTVPAGATLLNVDMSPIGAPLAKGQSSYGSTMPRFTATVKKLDGTIVAEVLPPTGQVESTSPSLIAPVAAGDYYLVIGRPNGVVTGDNDFYATTVGFTATNNAPEGEALGGHTNDALASAEALTMTADPTNAKAKYGGILAYLPTGDVADNFSFAVGKGDSIEVGCGAARIGSGLQKFKADLFLAGTSKQSETESATTDLAWRAGTGASKAAVVASAAGTAVLQLTSGGVSTTNTGTYYQCAVYVTSP